MANYTLKEDLVVQMKLHYQQEYATTLQKLQELKSVLEQLDGVSTSGLELLDTSSATSQVDKTPEQSSNDQSSDTATKEKKTSKSNKRSYKKKRGRKPVWGKFIISQLKKADAPVSYDDMASYATAIKGIPPEEFDKTRRKIISAAFSLRKKQDKIDNYAIKGSRTKYMGLKEWFEREGLLNETYKNKIVVK